MKTTHTLLALTVLLMLSPKPVCGQSTFKLDPKTTIYIDKAQLECIYEYKVNAPVKESKSNVKEIKTYKTILQANGSVSKFWDWHSFKKDSIKYSSSIEIPKDSINKLNKKYYFKVENLFTPVLYKNYPNEKCTVTDEISFNDYFYTENKSGPSWELKDDTLTVCGYLCNKAVTSFGGKVWAAWYTPEITLSDGPWKLQGLPGIILKAQDSSGTHSFEAIAIRNSERPIYMDINMMQIKIDKKLYQKNKQEFESLNVNDIMDVSSFDLKGSTTMNIDGKRLSLNRTATYCPLEE